MAKKKEKDTETAAPDKEKLLANVMKDIEKEYGKGAIMKLGDRPTTDVEPIPSGSLLLDQALGIGGYPKGRVIEIFGPESSGKTTLALHAVAEVQKKGGRAAYIDAENAIDPVYARNLGVNIDELILSQPDSGEQGLNIMLMLIASGAVDLVIVDSVAALTPQVELDGEMGDLQVGAQARMMSKAMRKLAGLMNHNDCTAIFINQLREKVGVMYGNPETTPGGRALKFYASVRIDIRKGDVLKNGTEVVGNKVKVKIVKNKVAPPFKTVMLEIMYGKGLSYISELIDLCVEANILKKAGAWYSYEGEKVGQGKEAAKQYILDHPEFKQELEDRYHEYVAKKRTEEEGAAATQLDSESQKEPEVDITDIPDDDLLDIDGIDLDEE